MASRSIHGARRMAPLVRLRSATFSRPQLHCMRNLQHRPYVTARVLQEETCHESNSSYISPLLAAFLGLGTIQHVRAESVQTVSPPQHDENVGKPPPPEPQQLVNWSGTHDVETQTYYQPETFEQLAAIVKQAHEKRQKVRPVGSALSPNGLAFQSQGMINMEHMDKITNIDIENRRVTLQAGARVSQVVEALRPHGLTLQNFASITEQQIGGFTQVSAHGTGAGIPPVDEQVLSIKLVTPAAGVLELSADDDDPSLFQLARASLGMLGVVAELTLQCVPAHKLVERTFVLSRAEVMGRHDELMKENKHLRYLWIPHTDAVVVVTCNPAPEAGFVAADKVSHAERLEPVRKLLRSHPDCKLTREQINELQFTSLRDELLALSPLDVSWVKRVNEAEAEVWRRSEGTRIDWSDQILQFDCGGQQWVCEVCLPVPDSVDAHVDIRYMYNLLDMIDRENVPAHAPIEQRWSAPSFSPMSPAAERPDRDLAKLYSWVGIIMYLPDAEVNAVAREAITKAFRGYKRLCERNLWQDARAVEHWAKIEMPGSEEEKALLQLRTYQKYPVDGFKAVCNIFDPHGILRNDLTETILGIS